MEAGEGPEETYLTTVLWPDDLTEAISIWFDSEHSFTAPPRPGFEMRFTKESQLHLHIDHVKELRSFVEFY
jgi:hypothetical protein